jgi:hypothetical protein
VQGLSLPVIGRAIGRDHVTVLRLLRADGERPSGRALPPAAPKEEPDAACGRTTIADQAAEQPPDPTPSQPEDAPPSGVVVRTPAPTADLQELCGIVALHLEAMGAGVTVDEVRGPRRAQRLVELRRTLARRLRSQGFSLPEIGRAIGRDHSTVFHLLRKGGEAEAGETSAAVDPKVEPAPADVDETAARVMHTLGQLHGPQREAVAVLVEALAHADQLERELAGYRAAARRVQRRVRHALRTEAAGAAVREAG